MKTLQELQAIREAMKSKIAGRSAAADNDIRIVVGMATCGIAAGARGVLNAFLSEAESRKLENVKVTQTGCMGMCAYEPIVEIFAPNAEKVTYVLMTPERVPAVVSGHIINGKPVEEFTYGYAATNGGGNK